MYQGIFVKKASANIHNGLFSGNKAFGAEVTNTKHDRPEFFAAGEDKLIREMKYFSCFTQSCGIIVRLSPKGYATDCGGNRFTADTPNALIRELKVHRSVRRRIRQRLISLDIFDFELIRRNTCHTDTFRLTTNMFSLNGNPEGMIKILDRLLALHGYIRDFVSDIKPVGEKSYRVLFRNGMMMTETSRQIKARISKLRTDKAGQLQFNLN